MKKLFIVLAALAFAAPAHAISVVSLHNSAPCNVMTSTSTVSWGVILAGLAALALVVGIRVLRRTTLS